MRNSAVLLCESNLVDQSSDVELKYLSEEIQVPTGIIKLSKPNLRESGKHGKEDYKMQVRQTDDAGERAMRTATKCACPSCENDERHKVAGLKFKHPIRLSTSHAP